MTQLRRNIIQSIFLALLLVLHCGWNADSYRLSHQRSYTTRRLSLGTTSLPTKSYNNIRILGVQKSLWIRSGHSRLALFGRKPKEPADKEADDNNDDDFQALEDNRESEDEDSGTAKWSRKPKAPKKSRQVYPEEIFNFDADVAALEKTFAKFGDRIDVNQDIDNIINSIDDRIIQSSQLLKEKNEKNSAKTAPVKGKGKTGPSKSKPTGKNAKKSLSTNEDYDVLPDDMLEAVQASLPQLNKLPPLKSFLSDSDAADSSLTADDMQALMDPDFIAAAKKKGSGPSSSAAAARSTRDESMLDLDDALNGDFNFEDAFAMMDSKDNKATTDKFGKYSSSSSSSSSSSPSSSSEQSQLPVEAINMLKSTRESLMKRASSSLPASMAPMISELNTEDGLDMTGLNLGEGEDEEEEEEEEDLDGEFDEEIEDDDLFDALLDSEGGVRDVDDGADAKNQYIDDEDEDEEEDDDDDLFQDTNDDALEDDDVDLEEDDLDGDADMFGDSNDDLDAEYADEDGGSSFRNAGGAGAGSSGDMRDGNEYDDMLSDDEMTGAGSANAGSFDDIGEGISREQQEDESNTGEDDDDTDSTNDPFENEYWRVLLRWDHMDVWDAERAAMLSETMVQTIAKDQARTYVANLPEMAFYRLHAGKDRLKQRFRYNRRARIHKRKLLHARLIFRARAEAKFLQKVKLGLINTAEASSSSSITATSTASATTFDETKYLLFNADFANIDPENEATFKTYNDDPQDGVVIDEQLAQELYEKKLGEFHELQRKLNESRIAEDEARELRARYGYRLYAPKLLQDILMPNRTAFPTLETDFEPQTKSSSTRKTSKKDDLSSDLMDVVTEEEPEDEDDDDLTDDDSDDLDDYYEEYEQEVEDDGEDDNDTDKDADDSDGKEVEEKEEKEGEQEGEKEEQTVAETVEAVVAAASDDSSSNNNGDAKPVRKTKRVLVRRRKRRPPRIDPFYEDFYADHFDDRKEANQLLDQTEIFASRIRRRLLDPASREETKLQLIRYNVQREDQELLRKVRAYWAGTYEKRFFYTPETARDEYEREAILYGYTEQDTYEEQMAKRVVYDQRRFACAARMIADSTDPKYARVFLDVNATHAVLYKNASSHPSRVDDASSPPPPLEVQAVYDFVEDNDDGDIVQAPTISDINRVNENNYIFFQEYAREFYAHWSPTFQRPFGDPYEALSWTNEQDEQEAKKQGEEEGEEVDENMGILETRPVITLRSVVSNYTEGAEPMIDIIETMYEAIRNGTAHDKRVRYEIYVLDRSDEDAQRFFALSREQQLAELEEQRDDIKQMHRILGATYDVSEKHMERLLPMEDMIHMWCEGHNVHHLIDGYTMKKLWGEMRADILLAPKNVEAIVNQVAYALYGEAESVAVLSKRLTTLRTGQEPEAYDARYTLGTHVLNLPGDEMAVVGGRGSFWRAEEDIKQNRRYSAPSSSSSSSSSSSATKTSSRL